MPLAVLWFAVIALEILCIARFRIAESDIWFHLRNASQSLTDRTFLHSDLYTFTSAGAPLLNHEWLAEMPYFAAFQYGGLSGLLAVYLVLLWAIFGGVYYLALRRGATCADGALVTMAGVALGCYSFGPRMLHFGWLCLVVVLIVLERFERTGAGLWILPPLFALWINLHGSWTFGLVVIGLFMVSGLLSGRWGSVESVRWSPLQLRKLLVTVCACGIALLINPYGYKLAWYPFDLLFHQQANITNVTEWQSVDFHTAWGKMALLTIFSVLAAVLFTKKPWKLVEIALICFALVTSLTHVRFLMFAAIILVPIVASRLQLFSGHDTKPDRPFLSVSVVAAIIAALFWIYPSRAELEDDVDTQFPRAALRFMQREHISGRLFHYYDFGGFIEWNAPERKTFADGRTDIFVYNGVFDDYLKIARIKMPLELLDKYKIDLILFPLDHQLCYLLEHSPGWRTIYRDNVVKLYERVR